MTQNVHNFRMCRANAISRMLYVNSVQLRFEFTHAYPIEILSQTRRYSRKLQKNESYIIPKELFRLFVNVSELDSTESASSYCYMHNV